MVKSYVNRRLQETTAQVTASVQAQSGPAASTGETSSSVKEVFPLIYGTFSAEIAKLKKLFGEIEKRRNGLPE
jgi:hypothetical protein